MANTEERAAATPGEPVAWGIRSVGKVRFFRMFDAAQGRYAAESLAELNGTAGLDPCELVPLYAAPAPQVAALTEELAQVHAAGAHHAKVTYERITELESEVASLSAALEAAKTLEAGLREALELGLLGSGYGAIDMSDREQALRDIRALAALPTGDAPR